jgi:hypothetical protein
MSQVGEYYRLNYINEEIFIFRTFGEKISGDLDLSTESIFFKLLQKIDVSLTLPLSKKKILFLIDNLQIEKYENILTTNEASILLFELNNLQLLVNAKIPYGLSYINFPKVFSNDDYSIEFPLPVRKVMFRPDICDICNRENIPDTEINVEWTDPDNYYGWYYCNDCKDRLMEYLQNSDTQKIWHLRENETILIERSSLDSDGNQIKEHWRIRSWLPKKVIDKISGEYKEALYCSNSEFYKYIFIDDILRLNPI